MRRLPFALLAACGTPQELDLFGDAPGFTLAVTPAELEIVTGPGGGEPVPYVATATFPDGTSLALETVDWSLSNRSVGTLDAAGLFTPTDLTGGRTWVTAELDGVVGQAELLVRYEEQIDAGEVDPGAFTAEPVAGDDAWLYPADGVNLPRNLPSLDFQWRETPGAVYALRFESAFTSIEVRTAQPRWIADGETWARIAATNAGGEVQVVLHTSVDGVVTASPPRTLYVNRLDAEGFILYWSTSKQGLVKIPFGGVAEDWWTINQSGHCVGCHTASSDGKVAFTYTGGNGRLGIRRVTDGSDILPFPANPTGSDTKANFSTFSPDGKLLITAYQGVLRLFDAETGTYLRDVLNDGNLTHPAWSPDGSKLAFVLQTDRSEDWVLRSAGAKIAVMDHLGDGAFGPWRVLVDTLPGENAYYPAFSPDGRWLAFNRSRQDMVSDPDAEVWVIDAEGTLDPIRLTAANGDTAAWDACTYAPDPANQPDLRAQGMYNSWPRWAPLPDDDVLWIAFSSSRAYGRVSTCLPQIWVAGFDPERARKGKDASWPAFWLPGQDAATGNHIPVWMR